MKGQEQNLKRILMPRKAGKPRWKRTILGDSQDCSQPNSEYPHFSPKPTMPELLSSNYSRFIFTSNYRDFTLIIYRWRYSEVKELPNIHPFYYCVRNITPEAKIIFLHSSWSSAQGSPFLTCTSVILDYFQFSAPA